MHETGSVLAAAAVDGRCRCGRGLSGRLVGFKKIVCAGSTPLGAAGIAAG
jgi:hypothetical protein